MSFVFDIPSTLFFGENCSNKCGELLNNIGAGKVLLVCDQAMVSLGMAAKLTAILEAADLEHVTFADVEPNPTDELVHKAANFAADHKVDALLAIGGGSVIDCAKAVNILLTNGGKILDYEGVNKVAKPTLPLVMVPTTAGTGSEVTSVTVVTDTRRHKKMVIAGQFVGGRIAVCDPMLTVKLPAAITSSTGMDALTHAIEAYISTLASPVTDGIALDAITLIMGSLEQAVAAGDIKSRSDMMLGSFMAGMAFNSALLGLVHSLAHPLSAHYNIPHGVANAVFLPHVMNYNLGSFDSKLKALASAMGIDGEQSDLGDRIVSRLQQLATTIGIPQLKDLGVPETDFTMLAEEAMLEMSTMTNPKQPTVAEIVDLLKTAYA